jgi:acyl dehydratase
MQSGWLPFRIGQRFLREALLTTDSIKTFAALVGDANPLHHDDALGRSSQFGAIIASGIQTSSIMASWAATIIAERCASVGLEIMFKFEAPVFADEALKIEIEVTDLVPKPRLDRYVITFDCKLTKSQSQTVAVRGYAKALLSQKL